LNPFRSGVARFNELLAEHLHVPVMHVFDERLHDVPCPLLSFKAAELSDDEQPRLPAVLESLQSFGVFLHDWAELQIEEAMVRAAVAVYAGNDAIARRIGDLRSDVATVWAPGLIVDDRPLRPAEISVFSFGMAHKIRVDMFQRLRELLDRTGKTYVVYVSAANHETASLKDAESVFDDMHDVFPDELYFLGNLSDVAVSHYLRHSTFFAAFFPGGVRANNTSIGSALAHGAVVLTNLDDDSPEWLVHMQNVIDVEACESLPSDPLELRRLGLHAMEAARERSWPKLIAALEVAPVEVGG
jgi:hypothetical protein